MRLVPHLGEETNCTGSHQVINRVQFLFETIFDYRWRLNPIWLRSKYGNRTTLIHLGRTTTVDYCLTQQPFRLNKSSKLLLQLSNCSIEISGELNISITDIRIIRFLPMLLKFILALR